MLSKSTSLIASDNSGAKIVECINVMGSSQRRYAKIGDTILVTTKKLKGAKKIIKKKIYRALVISTVKEKQRRKGYSVKFDQNRVLMLSEQDKFLGTRVYGPICKEIRGGEKENLYKQIIYYSRYTV